LTKAIATGLVWLMVLSLMLVIMKAIALLGLVLLALGALVLIHRVRPTVCYAICIAAAVALTPKVAWPWVGLALVVWLLLEAVQVLGSRFGKPRGLMLPRD